VDQGSGTATEAVGDDVPIAVERDVPSQAPRRVGSRIASSPLPGDQPDRGVPSQVRHGRL